MALKKQNTVQAAFSMASMTDVIFLLLIFFMVSAKFDIPTAVDITLPQSAEHSSAKPSTRVYINKDGAITVSYAQETPQSVDDQQLSAFLQNSMAQDTTQTAVAIYADEEVAYGRIVDVLNIGATSGIKMVLATRPVPRAATPTATVTP